MVQVPPLPVELAHRAAAAVPAPSPSPTRPPRPGWARARGEPIAATASSGGSQPTDEHVGPERGGAGKEHNPRAQRHRSRLRQHARDAEYEERDRDHEARCHVERKSQQRHDHDTSSLYLTATSLGQSSICTRATSRYLPSSGLKIDASPSFTSNQSLPKASMMLGLCVIRKVFLPFSGICASILRRAAARRLFSSGDTTRPPSVRLVVFSMSLNPASTAVSKARLKLLV